MGVVWSLRATGPIRGPEGGQFDSSGVFGSTGVGASGGRGWNLADGTDEVASLATVFRCSTSRFADDWLIGSQRFTKVTQDQHFFTEAFRTNCDVGLFPANGMVYADSTRCECLEFIRSHGGFAADRLPAEPWAGERLHRGPAKAAAAEVDAAVPGKQWPMFMHDGARSNWTDARLPAGDRIAWKVGYEPPARLPLVWREARRHEFIKQPVTAPVVAAGLVVTADSHRGIVRAMAPEDGSTRWRFVADGRIDTPPTIHGGAVYFATRTGWVYAVDREGGKLIWRYFAPPHPNLILDHAQAESTWPAFGSLVVADGLVWACVGRNAELDHGLTFVGLDPASGEPRVRRVMAEQQDWHKDYGDGSVVDTWRRRNGRMLAPNAPLLTDGDAVLTGWFGVTTEGEPANIAQDGEGRLRRVTRPGSVNSILAPRDSGRSKPAYGHAAGIVQAFNGDDVFVVDKNFRLSFDRITDWEPSERNPDADKTERRWSARLPSIRNIRGEGLLDFPGPATVLVRTADGLLTGNAWMPQLELRRIDDGSVLRTMTLPAPPVQHGVAVVDGMVVVTCDDGSVVAFK